MCYIRIAIGLMRHVSARMRVCGAVLCALAVMSAAPRAQTGQALRVVPLVHGDQVLVSFELTDGLTNEVRQAILSGLKTTFTYTLELRLDVPAWVDRTIGVATVTSCVE